MARIDWIYASENIRPKEGEQIICDFGKNYPFKLLVYEQGRFIDRYDDGCNYYYIGDNVKRWCSIGKHFDEQF